MKLWARLTSMPLRWKLLLTFVPLTLCILVLATFVGAEYARDVQPITTVLVESLARERSLSLRAVMENIISDVDSLGSAPELRTAYTLLARRGGFSATPRVLVERAFQTLLDSHPNYWQLRLVSADGELLSAIPPVPELNEREQEYYLKLNGQPPTEDVFIGKLIRSPEASMDFVRPIVEDEQIIGYLVLAADPEGRGVPNETNIFTTIRPLSIASGLLTFYMVTEDGVIEAPVPVLSNTPDSQATVAQLLSTQFVAPIEYISPVLQRAVLGFAVRLPYDRILVAEAQVVPISRPGEAGRFYVGLTLLGALTLLVTLASAIFLNATVIRPLRNVTQIAERAARGRFTSNETVILPTQSDEIGKVADAINALGNLSRRDIRSLEARVAERTRDLDTTREIGQIIFTIRDVDALMQRVTRLLCDRFERVDYALIFSLSGTRQILSLEVAAAKSGEPVLESGYRTMVTGQLALGRAVTEAQPVVEIYDSPTVNDLIPDARALLVLPLRSRDGLFGTLALYSTRSEAFGDVEIRLFQAIADQVAVAIANAQLYQEGQSRMSEIQDLNRRILGEAWRGYEVARRRASPRRGYTAPEHDESWSDLQLEAFRSGEIQERIEGDTVAFAVPVMLRDQSFGAVEWVVPRATYSENTRLLARELAARLAVAADNARLIEQSQRLAERERLVNTISDRLSRQTNVSDVLKTAVKELGQALRLPQASIRLSSNTYATDYNTAGDGSNSPEPSTSDSGAAQESSVRES